MNFLHTLTIGQWVFFILLAFIVVLLLVFREGVGKGMARTGVFYREVRLEMKKVSWPSRQEVIGSTVVVLFTVVVLSFLIGVEDSILVRLIQPLFSVK